jgi:hypothetical protein
MNIKSVFNYLFVLIVPSVIFSFAANSIILVLCTLISIWFLKKNPPQNIWKKYLLFNAFTLVIVIGLLIDLISQNTLDFNQISKRLSFVLIPVVFSVASKQTQNLALKTYVFFLTLLSSVLLIAGLVRSVINKDQIIYGNWDSETTERFYQNEMFINWGELSYKRLFFFFDMHPSYYALFSIIAIIILIFTQTIKLKKLLKWSFILIHMIMIIFLSSKTGIISLFIVLLAYLFIGQSNKNRLIGASVVLLLALIIVKTPSTEIRLKSAYKSLKSDGNLLNMSSTSERLALWNSLADLSLKELVVGVGNTGGRDRIVTNTGIDKNMHNQFLQSLLNAGFIGFSLITIFVFLPLFFKRNIFTISLVLIVFVNLLFENMLDRIWGITAISFFYAFIIFGSAEMLNFKSAKN